MKKLLAILLFITINNALAFYNFFENSIRTSPTNDEAKYFVKVVKKGEKGRCSGLLVSNNAGKIYVGSARHCFSYKAAESCQNDEIRVLPSNGNISFVGKCQKIVVSSPKDDTFIMEITAHKDENSPASSELAKEIKKNLYELSLANYEPPVFLHLKLYGFPSDDNRKGAATVSSNCRVQPGNSPHAMSALTTTERIHYNQVYEEKHEEYFKEKNKVEEPYLEKLEVTKGKMNCSVYGGNSGGPLVIENTYDLIGLPFSYNPSLNKTIPSNYAHSYERIKEFIQRNKAQIEAAKINISYSIKRIKPNFNYLIVQDNKNLCSNSDVFYNGCASRISVDTANGILSMKLSSCPRESDNGKVIQWICENENRGQYCLNTVSQNTYFFIHKLKNNGFEMIYSSKKKVIFTD